MLANVINNLPAVLVLVLLPLTAPAGPGAVLAVLLGVNIGPQHAPVSFGQAALVTGDEDEEFRFFAGFRSDPFFFDLLAFLAGLKFTNPGSDFFIDKNVFGIELEVPSRRRLGPNPKVGYWARTLIPVGGDLVPDDQMGRPAAALYQPTGTGRQQAAT